MRSAQAPMLFDDHDPRAGEQQRSSVMRSAQRSPAAQQQAAGKRTADDLPVHSVRILIAELGTLTVSRCNLPRAEAPAILSLFRRFAGVIQVSPRAPSKNPHRRYGLNHTSRNSRGPA